MRLDALCVFTCSAVFGLSACEQGAEHNDSLLGDASYGVSQTSSGTSVELDPHVGWWFFRADPATPDECAQAWWLVGSHTDADSTIMVRVPLPEHPFSGQSTTGPTVDPDVSMGSQLSHLRIEQRVSSSAQTFERESLFGGILSVDEFSTDAVRLSISGGTWWTLLPSNADVPETRPNELPASVSWRATPSGTVDLSPTAITSPGPIPWNYRFKEGDAPPCDLD